MTNPKTGEHECDRTTATPEEGQQHIDEAFSAARYYDFEMKQRFDVLLHFPWDIWYNQHKWIISRQRGE